MTIQITMSDLISSLRKAASRPEAHAPAQRTFFSALQEDSVLVNCGTACCIAGDLLIKAHADEKEDDLKQLIISHPLSTGRWVSNQLGLTKLEAVLAFDSRTHYRVHELLANLLESGLRLSHSEYVVMSNQNTYTYFHRASLGAGDKKGVDLDGLLDWMQSIAR